MAQTIRRVLAAMLGLMMLATTGLGLASAAANNGDIIVDEWVDAFRTRDPAIIEAMPGSHPSIPFAERAVLARAVFDQLLLDDEEAAALFVDPTLTDDERAQRVDEAVELLSGLMFDRNALIAKFQADALVEDTPLMPTPLAPAPGLVDGLAEAAARDVANLLTVPTDIATVAVAAIEGARDDVPTPAPIDASPFVALASEIPLDSPFAVCWISAGGQSCAEILPLSPMPVDVTFDGIPDVLVTLSILGDPTALVDSLTASGTIGQLTLSVQRLPTLDDAPLQALILGVFHLDDQILLAGYDAFSADVPADARAAPTSVTIVASAGTATGDSRAHVIVQAAGAGDALRTLAGVTKDAPWDPAELMILDTTPVPGTLDVNLRAWRDLDGSHFEGTLDMDRPVDLVGEIRERDVDNAQLSVARLSAVNVGPTLALSIHQGAAEDAWSWESASTVDSLRYELERTRYTDSTLAAARTWDRQALVLQDLPVRLDVTLPGHGSVTLDASGVIGSVSHVRQSYDFATSHERYEEAAATDVPVHVTFLADEVSGVFTSVGSLSSLSFQSATLETSAQPGAIGALLFDLSGVTTNFIGLRGETATGGDAIALQLVNVPDSLTFALDEVGRGVGLDLAMSRGLGPVNGIIQIDDHRGILYLSNIPKTISLSASFDAATAVVGYDATSGINEALALFTDLSLTNDPTTVHAFVQLLQLPRSVSLSLTRSGDAPKLVYSAATSTADVRAFVDEALFAGDLKARALLWVDDLGASTTLSLQKIAGQDVLRLLSQPPTARIVLEGYVAQAYTGALSKHLKERCCWDAFGYDVYYGYNIAATIKVVNMRVVLADVSSLDLTLRVPDLSVTGTFGDFVVAWDTISIIGNSAAWLRVDLRVFWIGINIWNWGWSSPTQYDLNVRITRYVDQWGPLASVSVSPCTLSLDVHPSAVESMTNGFRIAGLNGQRQWLIVNPIGSNGQTAIPSWLASAYMAWQYGGWRINFGC